MRWRFNCTRILPLRIARTLWLLIKNPACCLTMFDRFKYSQPNVIFAFAEFSSDIVVRGCGVVLRVHGAVTLLRAAGRAHEVFFSDTRYTQVFVIYYY